MNVLKRFADSTEIFGILCRLSLCIGLLMIPGITAAQEQATETDQNRLLDAMPEGYFLHAYDDCGVPERQPRVRMEDSYCWAFQTSDTDADLKSRSAVFSYKAVKMVYPDLDPSLSYVLAVTYASDHVSKRPLASLSGKSQSLTS